MLVSHFHHKLEVANLIFQLMMEEGGTLAYCSACRLQHNSYS